MIPHDRRRRHPSPHRFAATSGRTIPKGGTLGQPRRTTIRGLEPTRPAPGTIGAEFRRGRAQTRIRVLTGTPTLRKTATSLGDEQDPAG